MLFNLPWLELGGQTVKNLLWLACKFDLDQSEHKSSQVNASAPKAWPNGVASSPKFSTCVYLRLRLSRALEWIYCEWLVGLYFERRKDGILFNILETPFPFGIEGKKVEPLSRVWGIALWGEVKSDKRSPQPSSRSNNPAFYTVVARTPTLFAYRK